MSASGAGGMYGEVKRRLSLQGRPDVRLSFTAKFFGTEVHVQQVVSIHGPTCPRVRRRHKQV